MKLVSPYIFICLLQMLCLIKAQAQKQPVQWTITIDSVSKDVQSVHFDARIAMGWHLYSQYIEEGGPIPTTFVFKQDGYKTLGVPSEEGKRVVFHDDTYDMEVSWYSDRVMFVQKIKLEGSAKVLKGYIDYMVCNGEVCLPSKKDFSLPISLGRK